MQNLFIDSLLFACPKLEEGKSSFESYIDNILGWRDLATSEWSNLFTLRETIEVLYNVERYPLHPHLRMAISKYEINYIQPQDIITIVDSLLAKIAKIQDHLSIEDSLYNLVSLSPEINEREEIFKIKISDLLTYASLKCLIDNENENLQKILLAQRHITSIDICSDIQILEFKNKDLSNNTPITLCNSFSCFPDYTSYCLQIDCVLIWSRTKDTNIRKEAIKLYAFQRANNLGIKRNLEEIANYQLKDSFLSSISALNLETNAAKLKLLLQTMSDVILNINLQNTHALRKGPKGNDPQICEGQWKAWRMDIDYEYHLHYWKKAETIIFSKMVLHNDFSIEL